MSTNQAIGRREGRNLHVTEEELAVIIAQYLDLDPDNVLLSWNVDDDGVFYGATVRVAR